MGAAPSVPPELGVDDNNEYDKESDKVVIQELYECTNGVHWHNYSGWGTGAHVKSWFGVTVDDEDRIIGLELRDNDLNGPLPSNIGRLKKLRWLLLGNNRNLTGTIPRELTLLRELRQLDLHNCSNLSGEIPMDIGNNLTKLVHLSFHNCKSLAGPLPDSFGKLVNLQELDLYNCIGIVGSLPPSFNRLTKLARLVLRSGQVCSLKGEPLDGGNLYHDQSGYHAVSIMKTKDSTITYDPQEVEERRREEDEVRWHRLVIEGVPEPIMAEFIEDQMLAREHSLLQKGFVAGRDCSTSASGMSVSGSEGKSISIENRLSVAFDIDSTVSDISVVTDDQEIGGLPSGRSSGRRHEYE